MEASVNRVLWSRKAVAASGVQTNALAVEVRAVRGGGDPAVVFDEAPVEISKTQKASQLLTGFRLGPLFDCSHLDGIYSDLPGRDDVS